LRDATGDALSHVEFFYATVRVPNSLAWPV
jgi:hypothetical protein